MDLINYLFPVTWQAGLPITSPKYYSNISLEEVNKIFLSSTGEPIPLLEERCRILHECGRILDEKFEGSFLNCLKQSNRSAQKLVDLIVTNFPSFRDEAVIENQTVSLYKRAQILVADIWGLFKGKVTSLRANKLSTLLIVVFSVLILKNSLGLREFR